MTEETKTNVQQLEEESTATSYSAVKLLKEMRSNMEEVHKNAGSVSLPLEIKLEDFTHASREILEHFGLDTPALLNEYSTQLEDVLWEMTRINLALRSEIHRCYETIDGFQDYRDRNVDDWATVRRLVKAEEWDQVLDVVPTLGR